jgi:uncharacterized membrane protein HdeD (DUF308 family)
MGNVNLLPNTFGKPSHFSRALHNHWHLFIIEGLIMICLGMLAIVFLSIGNFTITVLLGWLFLVGGCVGLLTTIMSRHASSFWWSLLSAAVTIGAGSALVGLPLNGTGSLVLALTAYLVADGVLRIAFAIDHHHQLSKRWEWFFVNGLIDLGLTGFIIVALPASSTWRLGLIIGIDMIFGGLTLIAMGRAVNT